MFRPNTFNNGHRSIVVFAKRSIFSTQSNYSMIKKKNDNCLLQREENYICTYDFKIKKKLSFIKSFFFFFLKISEPHYLILEYVMYGKLLAYLRDHRTRQDFYNFSEDSAALTSRDLTVFGYCVARGMEYLASKKVGFLFI